MGRTSFFLSVVLGFLLLTGSTVLAQEDGETLPQSTNENGVPLQFQVGHNAYHQGELTKARRRLLRQVRSDTPDPRARYWLGKTFFELGNNDSAAAVLSDTLAAGQYRDWYRRALENFHSIYDTHSFPFHRRWQYVGLIEGKQYGQKRNVNPSSLVSAPNGGWYSTAYKPGKLLHYSEEGKVLRTWGGLETPTDILVHPELGILVSELDTDRVMQVRDTGIVPFTTEGIDGPSKLLRIGSSLFVFNSGSESIVSLSQQGDTIGTVWTAPLGVDPGDVAVGPDDRFWILNTRNNTILVVNRWGRRLETHSYDRNLDLRKLWWRKNKLLSVSSSGILSLDRKSFSATYLSAQGETLPGSGVSDVLFSGDRMVLSVFPSSQLLIYRPLDIPSPDIVMKERRMDFSDFPVVRMNVLVEDPLQTDRFEHLSDQDLGISVDNQDILPSLLRHAGDVYGRNWIILVDNRIPNNRVWEEIRPFLESVIDSSPEESEGGVWRTVGENPIAQNFTAYETLLNNSLNRLSLYGTAPSENSRSLATALNQAYNALFSLRGPGGIILVSRHLRNASGLRRIANRSMNSHYPLVVVNPSSGSLPDSHPFEVTDTIKTMNFKNLNKNKIWTTYRNALRHHYTAIYRSNLRFQPSSLWQEFQLRIYYFDRTGRHNSGFLFP